jgi:anti-sigma regulatory factor (Ser/Thr protein kinase)
VGASRLSREFVREMLALWNADDLTEVAELLTAELVTNVVCHAVTSADVALLWDEPTLRVEIRDGSAILPAITDLPKDEHGRGLHIVSALARQWGTRRLGEGKTVWFTVTRQDGPSDQPSGS